MIIQRVVVGEFQVNCYVVAAEKNAGAVIIDPGSQAKKIRKALQADGLVPGIIINTHGHFDHIGSDDDFGVPVYIHTRDMAALGDPELNLSTIVGMDLRVTAPVREVSDGDIISHAGVEFEVRHVPGHSPGGIVLLMRKPQGNILFSGDSLFQESIGRTDFPGADGTLLVDALRKKVLCLEDSVVVYPGHGPSTTIGRERTHNFFLRGS